MCYRPHHTRAPFPSKTGDVSSFKVFKVERASPMTTCTIKVTQLRKEQHLASYLKCRPVCDCATVTRMPPLCQKTKAPLYVDGSIYRSCGSMRRGTRHGSSKSDSQHRQEH